MPFDSDSETGPQTGRWKELRVCSSRPEAEILAGLLRSHSIKSRVSADDLGGLRPHLALTLGVKVLVPEEDFEEAQRLMNALFIVEGEGPEEGPQEGEGEGLEEDEGDGT